MKINRDSGLLYVQKLGFRVARNARAGQSVLEKKVGTAKAKECNDWFEKRADQLGKGDIQAELDFYAFKNSSLQLSMAISEIFDADYIRRFCSWLGDNQECFGDKILDVGCDNGIITCFIAQLCPDAKVIGIDRCKESIISARLLAEQFNLNNVEFVHDSLDKYPEKDFDTVVALRISQENVKEPEVGVYDSFFNISTAYKEALLQHSRSLISLLNKEGNLITGQMVGLDPYYFGQMLCFADMGWFPVCCDNLQYMSYENNVPLSAVIWANHDINKEGSRDDFAEKLKNVHKELNCPFMGPYFSNFGYFYLGGILKEQFEKQKISLHDSIYFGWLANIFFEEKVSELILGYVIYFKNNETPMMYSLWKNTEDPTAIIYFGASHIYSDGDMHKPNPCWANMDISRFEYTNQSLLDFVVNAAESGMIRKICTLNVTDDGRFVESESSVEEVTQATKNRKYHDLQKPGGLADFLRENL